MYPHRHYWIWMPLCMELGSCHGRMYWRGARKEIDRAAAAAGGIAFDGHRADADYDGMADDAQFHADW